MQKLEERVIEKYTGFVSKTWTNAVDVKVVIASVREHESGEERYIEVPEEFIQGEKPVKKDNLLTVDVIHGENKKIAKFYTI